MFSLNLKTIREEKRLSQRELAKILGVSQGSVGNWEAGTREPDFETVKKIADYFKISTDYLLGKTDHYTHPNAPNIEVYPKRQNEVTVFPKGDVPGQKKEVASMGDLEMSEEDKAVMERVLKLDPEGRKQAMTYLDFLLSQDGK